MAFKKISDLVEATGLANGDLFLVVDVLGTQSKKMTFQTLHDLLAGATTSDLVSNQSSVVGTTVTDALNNLLSGGGSPEVANLIGRFGEGSDYTFHKDSEGLIDYIETNLGMGLSKRWTFTRNVEGFVSTLNIHKSDSSYNKTYTFNRDVEGLVSSISIA